MRISYLHLSPISIHFSLMHIIPYYPSMFDLMRYAQLLSAFRPCVDLVLSGLTARDATDATRRIFRTLQVACGTWHNVVEQSQRQTFVVDSFWLFLIFLDSVGWFWGYLGISKCQVWVCHCMSLHIVNYFQAFSSILGLLFADVYIYTDVL
jgi:hypothetical protein